MNLIFVFALRKMLDEPHAFSFSFKPVCRLQNTPNDSLESNLLVNEFVIFRDGRGLAIRKQGTGSGEQEREIKDSLRLKVWVGTWFGRSKSRFRTSGKASKRSSNFATKRTFPVGTFFNSDQCIRNLEFCLFFLPRNSRTICWSCIASILESRPGLCPA